MLPTNIFAVEGHEIAGWGGGIAAIIAAVCAGVVVMLKGKKEEDRKDKDAKRDQERRDNTDAVEELRKVLETATKVNEQMRMREEKRNRSLSRQLRQAFRRIDTLHMEQGASSSQLERSLQDRAAIYAKLAEYDIKIANLEKEYQDCVLDREDLRRHITEQNKQIEDSRKRIDRYIKTCPTATDSSEKEASG